MEGLLIKTESINAPESFKAPSPCSDGNRNIRHDGYCNQTNIYLKDHLTDGVDKDICVWAMMLISKLVKGKNILIE